MGRSRVGGGGGGKEDGGRMGRGEWGGEDGGGEWGEKSGRRITVSTVYMQLHTLQLQSAHTHNTQPHPLPFFIPNSRTPQPSDSQ